MQVNTNGILSFNAPSRHFSRTPFPLASQTALHSDTYNIIAPFWGDVDTTNNESGRIWYRQTTDRRQLSQASRDVLQHFRLYPDVDLRNFNPLVMVVVTWDHVGYFQRQSDKVE